MMSAAPEWIERWLEIASYGEKCERHPQQYKTLCCAACMEHLVCRCCWLNVESKKHCGDRHPVLDLRKASNRAAILVGDMRKFMEVSDIQVYSFNGKRHLHLTPKPEASLGSPPHCKTCRRKLITLSYNFCSIACKVHYGGGDLLKINEWEEGDEVELEGSSAASHEIDSVDEVEGRSTSPSPSHSPINNSSTSMHKIKSSVNSSSLSGSLRRRSRKRIPHRAPLQ